MRRNRRTLQVEFNGVTEWVPEAHLEDAGQRLSPLDMLEEKRLGRPIDLRRTLTHVKLSGRLADVIYSMQATNTDFYAYQFKPVVKLLESPSNAILIADEVGLGKTIETGLIWTELRSRFDMRRLVVLCPAALREKWKYELSAKFGVDAQICDARDALQVLQDEESHSRGFALIASHQGLRPPRGWDEKEEPNSPPAAKLAHLLRSKENDERLIDLLVIDEAHHLRNAQTKTYELGSLLKGVSAYAAFLTATPVHNRNDDLFSLLQLLDGDTFTRKNDFVQILEANRPLVAARDHVLRGSVDAERVRELLEEAGRHPLLHSNRQLAMIKESDLADDRISHREVRSRLAYRLETVNLLAHVVTRTRKRDVKEWRVLRAPTAELVALEPVERKFYNLVTEVVVLYAAKKDASERFLLAQPQRQMTSSMPAALRAWQQKLVELEEATETGETDDEKRTRALGPLVSEIVRRSHDYVGLDELIKVDTKYGRLRETLTTYLRDHPEEKIVVFSTFRATLAYLAERLGADGISCIQLKGGQRETKDETIARFRDPDGPSVLLSSEVGGEGVDLQFSRLVVNYDLPWNPMRLEQRIGRIDRLGQEASKVLIWNILSEDTIDARIYQRLYEKLDLCRTALGDFEAILGEEIQKLELELLAGKLTDEEQERRIDQTAQALSNLRLEEQRLEDDASSLVAYGDYILKHVQAARDLHRWVSGEDIRRYIFDHLSLNYPGCELRQIEPGSPIFEVALSKEVKYDLAAFIRNHRLPHTTQLTSPQSRSVRCRFQNRVGVGTAFREEVISQFHPLMRMVSAQINDGDEQLTPAVAVKLRRSDAEGIPEPGLYVLAAVLWSIQGLQESERLAYAAVPLDGATTLLDPQTAERLAVAAITHGEDWIEARNQIDLEHAHHLADNELLAHLDDEFDFYVAESEARNKDRADIQLRTLDRHLAQQRDQLRETREKHLRHHGRSSLVKATDGRITALENRVLHERRKIEERREVSARARAIAIAVIQIV